MTNSEHMHGHTTVTVDDKSTMTSVTQFLKNNKTTIGVVLVGVAVVLTNRLVIRKELRSINFSAEFWPDDFVDSDYVSDFME